MYKGLIFTILLSSCTLYSTSRGRLPSSYYEEHKVTMMGASNTAGMGSSLSFPDRINEYLKRTPREQKNALRNQKVFIAFDYFFPTNFSAINDSSVNHIDKADEAIDQWLEEYDQIIVMQLPHTDDEMKDRARKYIENAKAMNPYKNIINVLSDPAISERVKDLNHHLSARAKLENKLHVMNFSGIYDYIHDYSYNRRNRAARRKAPKTPKPADLFADPLHLNDKGQAVFYNAIIRPKLNDIFNLSLPQMKVATIAEEEVRDIIRDKLCDSDTFLEQDECQYWVVLKDPSQYELGKAKLHLPAGYTESGIAEVIMANKQKKIWDVIEELDTDFKRKSTLDVMAIAEIIDGNGESAESGLMIKVLNNRQKVYLDLSKVLFFTTFPIFADQESGIYSNWGYDHWLSYKYLYTKWSYSGMYSDLGLVGRMNAPAPGTNYKIDVKFDKEEKELRLTWRVYATVEGQKDEASRLEYIPEPSFSLIKNNPESYPYLEYQLDFKLDNMD